MESNKPSNKPARRVPAPRRGPSGLLLYCLRATAAVLLILCIWLAIAVWWNISTAGATRHPAVLAFNATVRDEPAEHLFDEESHEHTGKENLSTHLAGLKYRFGRWRNAVRDVTFFEDEPQAFSVALHKLVTLKRWHYVSLNSDRFFLGFALVHFSYVADVFFYLVDKQTNATQRWEYHGRTPFGLGLNFAPSSIQGCSEWSDSLFHLEHKDLSVCYDPVDRLWHILATLKLESEGQVEPISLILNVAPTETLALLFPLDGSKQRPAYVHKSAGMVSVGKLTWKGEEHFLEGLAAFDWTKSLALRETKWKWASFSAYMPVSVFRISTQTDDNGKSTETIEEELIVNGRSEVGINLSTDVYDYKGHSQENAVWINGTMFPLAGVAFRVPSQPLASLWSVRSLHQAAIEVVDLTFRPYGSREDHTHIAAMIISDFVQPYGYVNGTIEFRPAKANLLYRIQIQDVFGVMEDHLAVW